MTTNALAIFVKTPFLSPVKTRLAKGIGEEKTAEFYRLAIMATQSLADEIKSMQHNDLTVYWAIAEAHEDTGQYWKSFPVVEQGSGSLGERLSHVYDQLREKHQNVFFMGADSPHINPLKLNTFILDILPSSFLLGETDDGGFYLFGGNLPLLKGQWNAVSYSQLNTAKELKIVLEQVARVKLIERSFDIDTVEDFKHYTDPLFDLKGLTLKQRELIQWVRSSSF